MATGETVFYRVRLEPGQRVRATATRRRRRPPGTRLGRAGHLPGDALLPGPGLLTSQEANLQGEGAVRVSAASPQVRVRNREAAASELGDPNVTTASHAGDYFVALQVDPLQAYLTGRVMQDRVSLAVDGQASGQPEYAT